MIFFGHEGPVLGSAWLGYHILKNKPVSTPSFIKPLARFFQTRFDFRMVLIGAILPDLIDKPLGHLIFRELISNGRIYAHTPLFFLLLFTVGLWLYRRKNQTWLITLAMADLGHLILDEVWNVPVTLLWPLLGWKFPRLDIDIIKYALNILDILLKNPFIFFMEIVGFLISLSFFIYLLKKKMMWRFIQRGVTD